MIKVYHATKTIDVCFVCEEGENLKEAAEYYIQEECRVPLRVGCFHGKTIIKELKDEEDIPNDWLDALPWGDNDDEIKTREYVKRTKLVIFK